MRKIKDGWHVLPGDGKEPDPHNRDLFTVSYGERRTYFIKFKDDKVVNWCHHGGPEKTMEEMRCRFPDIDTWSQCTTASLDLLRAQESKWGISIEELMVPRKSAAVEVGGIALGIFGLLSAVEIGKRVVAKKKQVAQGAVR